MIYNHRLRIPASTSATAPYSEVMPVGFGVIKRCEVYIPTGSAGLAGLRVLRGAYQLYPTSPGQWFYGDDVTIFVNDSYEFIDPPYAVEVQGYNDDTSYDHDIIVRLEILPPSEITNQNLLALLFTNPTKANLPDGM